MTVAQVITIGQEQLIALPAEVRLDTNQVEVFQMGNRIFFDIYPTFQIKNPEKSADNLTERRQKFLKWRKEYEQVLAENPNETRQNPWENVNASQDTGRDFSWGNA